MSNKQWGNICNQVDTCALSGAGAFFAGIPNARIVVNGPLWCYFYAMRYLTHSDYRVPDYYYSTQPNGNAVVFGNEKNIVKTLTPLLEQDFELLCIESSCSMSLIGDDVVGIAQRVGFSQPIIAVDCGGLVGGFAKGYEKACKQVIQELAQRDCQVHASSVNLIGMTDFYLHGKADRQELCRILTKAGYTINAIPGGGSTVEELKQIGQAALNIVCHEELGLEVAEYLQATLGTPYVNAGLPYGIEGTGNWLKKINEALPAGALEAVEAELQEVDNYLTHKNNDYSGVWGNLWFDNVAVIGPSTMVQYLASAVRGEWLDTGKLIAVLRNKQENSEINVIIDEQLIAEKDETAIAKYWEDVNKVLVLGSSNETSALNRREACEFASCHMAYPTSEEVLWIEEPCMGIRGTVYMQQRIWQEFIRMCLAKNS